MAAGFLSNSPDKLTQFIRAMKYHQGAMGIGGLR